MIDLSVARVFNSPADIAAWAETGRITSLTMSLEKGVSIEFTTKPLWPDFKPAGWDGSIEYTIWVVVNTGAGLETSGIIQMWRDRDGSGAYETGSFFTDFHKNWAYDGRWGDLNGYIPKPGDTVGFFVSAGNARGEGGVTSIRERSNVIEVTLPANDRITVTNSVPTPVPTPTPVPSPTPSPVPEPGISINEFAAAVLQALGDLQVAVKNLSTKIDNLPKSSGQPASYQGKFLGAQFTLLPK